jgi:lipid-binding SYLF domain-containing protein
MNEIMATPDRGVPEDLLNKSACVIVVPGLKKGAFIVGAKYGKGFFVCRREHRGWSAPAAIRVEGGSFGFQIGGSETDVVMLLMNEGGIKKLLADKFTVGADASVAAGPVGRESEAQTDAQMHAEMLTYSRSRGAFAGIALQGATLRPDGEWNEELYGKKLSEREIVLGPTAPPPGARRFLETLNKYSGRRTK